MKALLYPLAIAMVITLAFGFFNNGLQFADLLMICLAIFTAIASNFAEQQEKKQKQHAGLQTAKSIIC